MAFNMELIERNCREALGLKKTVRTAPNKTVTGTIISAQFVGERRRQRSVVAKVKIVMECGVNKMQREFVVERLPY